jgi:hypothetical protein
MLSWSLLKRIRCRKLHWKGDQLIFQRSTFEVFIINPIYHLKYKYLNKDNYGIIFHYQRYLNQKDIHIRVVLNQTQIA